MADDDLSERVMDIEVRLAYQDRTITTLDEVVRELAKRLERAERELAKLREAPVSSTTTPNE
jgi:uncharacterized coiled-coil protein SlyX